MFLYISMLLLIYSYLCLNTENPIIMINPLFLFSMPGGMEWVLIVLAVIILFGGKKIPELARGLGKGIREFKDAKNQVSSEIKKESESVEEKKDQTA